MPYFFSNSKAVSTAIDALKTYPNLLALMNKDGKLFEFWYSQVKKHPEGFEYFSSRRLTVFSIAGIVGFGKANNISNEWRDLLEGMLKRLEQIVLRLEKSKNLDKYMVKLRNPIGTSTISSFSELLLAHHFQTKGFSIEFDFPYDFPEGGVKKNRNCDLRLENTGNTFFIEVYTPFVPVDDSEVFHSHLGESYSDFIGQIQEKIDYKFGRNQEADAVIPLSQVVLAVNARYYDMVSVDLSFPIGVKTLVSQIRAFLSPKLPIGGLIIYQTYDGTPSLPLVFHHFEIKGIVNGA